MTNDEYVEYVWRRISRGRPQNEIGVYRNAIQSTMPAALQKLATYVCADDALSTILQRTYGLVLMGPVTIENYLSVAVGALSPTLLLSKDSQDKWIVMIPTLSDFPLQRLPNFTSLRNPPPTPDFYFYTLYKSRIYVVDSTGESPPAISGYDMSLTGNYVPEIDDPSLEDSGQLTDDLIDIGIELMIGQPSDAKQEAKQQ